MSFRRLPVASLWPGKRLRRPRRFSGKGRSVSQTTDCVGGDTPWRKSDKAVPRPSALPQPRLCAGHHRRLSPSARSASAGFRFRAEPPWRLVSLPRWRETADPLFRRRRSPRRRCTAEAIVRFGALAVTRLAASPTFPIGAEAPRQDAAFAPSRLGVLFHYRVGGKPPTRFSAGAHSIISLTSPPKRLCRKARRRKGGSPPCRKSGKPPDAQGRGRA